MKKRIIIVLGILIAAGGIGTGVWYHFYGNTQGKTGDSIVYVSKVSVISGTETAAVNRFAGVVEPQKTVNVKIESGRKVKEVEVKTGEEIEHFFSMGGYYGDDWLLHNKYGGQMAYGNPVKCTGN